MVGIFINCCIVILRKNALLYCDIFLNKIIKVKNCIYFYFLLYLNYLMITIVIIKEYLFSKKKVFI